MKQQPMSQRAFARRLGINHSALAKGIRDGRLSKSITRVNGVAKIADPDLAEIEWRASRRPRADDEPPPTAEDYQVARARRESALADLAEIERDERSGKLVEVATVRAEVIDAYTIVKTKLLGIPARIKQRMPHIATADIGAIDGLIREALEALADGRDESDDEQEQPT